MAQPSEDFASRIPSESPSPVMQRASSSTNNGNSMTEPRYSTLSPMTEGIAGAPISSSNWHRGAAVALLPPFQSDTLITIDKTQHPRETQMEMVALICGWLEENNFTTTLQMLREEAGLLHHKSYNKRKAYKNVSQAIDDGNWDLAYQSLTKNEDLKEDKALWFLLVKQQLQETVEAGDGQKAFQLFMKKLKPMESSLSPQEFQSLMYLLTCKSVSEAATKYNSFRHWTIDHGRHYVKDQMKARLEQSNERLDQSFYIHQHAIASPARNHLWNLILQGLSFQYVRTLPCYQRHILPSVVVNNNDDHADGQQQCHHRIEVRSVVANVLEQLPPVYPEYMFNTSLRIQACQPFPKLQCIAIGTVDGKIILCRLPTNVPLDNSSSSCGSPVKESLSGSGGVVDQQQSKVHQYSSSVMVTNEKCSEFVNSHAAIDELKSEFWMRLPKGNDSSLSEETATPCVLKVLGQYPGRIWAMCGTEDMLVTCGSDGIVMLFDIATKVQIGILSGHGDALSIAVSRKKRCIASGGFNGEIVLWDVPTLSQKHAFHFCNSNIVSLCFSFCEIMLFAAAKNGIIYCIDVITGVLVRTFSPPIETELSSVALSPSSQYLLAAYKNNSNRIWDLVTGELLQARMIGHANSGKNYVPCCFGRQEQHCFSGSENGCVFFWDISAQQESCAKKQRNSSETTGNSIPSVRGYSSSGVQQQHFDPSGTANCKRSISPQILFSSSSLITRGPVDNIGPPSLEPHHRMALHQAMVRDLKMDAEYGLLVSCSEDGRVCICTSQPH